MHIIKTVINLLSIFMSEPINIDNIESLIQPAIEEAFKEVREYFIGHFQPVVDRLDTLEKAVSKPAEDSKTTEDTDQTTEDTDNSSKVPLQDMNPEQKALLDRIALLEKQVTEANRRQEEQNKALADARFNQGLSSVLDGYNPLHRGIVQELLSNRLRGKAQEVNGEWLVDGQKLQEVADGFFQTPEGMHFLQSQAKQGVGASEGNVTKGNSQPTVDQMMSLLM